ncbi:hypothetical protein FIBSPDRAFT_954936 [Athelia psychrophila]|uniref:Major facilitator superfamily (MFS) profile domain-containing protein n=1 Tax=Athelia psychrophila TaxID=1759441 RepID=A0A166IRG3_9AGAM|nr:hypothetical protein FIBSPDRAFT_954936 [Fibularhizoctonia sp. CBS 109695]
MASSRASTSSSPETPSNPEPQSASSTSSQALYFVDWDGSDDPENPHKYVASTAVVKARGMNGSVFQLDCQEEMGAMLAVSAFTFISPIASSMVAPAAEQVAEEFGITSTMVESMVFSVFGVVCIGAGTILPFQCIQSYIVVTFAMAGVSCFQSLAGFGFHLFAPTCTRP